MDHDWKRTETSLRGRSLRTPRARLAGAIARMSGAYQSGMTTMQRIRSGGTQRVIVQHVTVTEGGKAVVAGQVETGGPAPGGECFKMKDEPHARILRQRLALANASPRCGASCRDGQPCRGAAMANGRCRMHGGPSTGPRTPEGLERSRKSNWKHGHYSAEAKRVRREARQQFRLLRQLIAAGNEDDVLDLISSM